MKKCAVFDPTPTAGMVLSVFVDVEQNGRRGYVVIPQIVMDSLEIPDALARVGTQRHQRIREKVVAQALSAIEIRAGAADGEENEIALRIGRDYGPGIRRARALRAAILPGIGACAFGILRDRIESPLEFAGDGIESAYFAAWLVDGTVVGDSGSQNDGVADDGGR